MSSVSQDVLDKFDAHCADRDAFYAQIIKERGTHRRVANALFVGTLVSSAVAFTAKTLSR